MWFIKPFINVFLYYSTKTKRNTSLWDFNCNIVISEQYLISANCSTAKENIDLQIMSKVGSLTVLLQNRGQNFVHQISCHIIGNSFGLPVFPFHIADHIVSPFQLCHCLVTTGFWAPVDQVYPVSESIEEVMHNPWKERRPSPGKKAII